MSFFKKFFTKEKEQELEQGLEKTKSGLFSKITKAVAGKSRGIIAMTPDRGGRLGRG